MIYVVAVEHPNLGKVERLETREWLLHLITTVAIAHRFAEALVDHDPGAECGEKAVVP
nr:MetaGeneMark_Unknown Function [uncultured bacterium]ALS90368.1 MetaGeneMark_Unknown Function [uncultured bacterium]